MWEKRAVQYLFRLRAVFALRPKHRSGGRIQTRIDRGRRPYMALFCRANRAEQSVIRDPSVPAGSGGLAAIQTVAPSLGVG
jgi:hypothetical protein